VLGFAIAMVALWRAAPLQIIAKEMSRWKLATVQGPSNEDVTPGQNPGPCSCGVLAGLAASVETRVRAGSENVVALRLSNRGFPLDHYVNRVHNQ